MSIILCRRMTMRSIIGFGNFSLLSVQEMIQTHRQLELIKMYYLLEKIDFDQEVKKMLKITEERSIPKPSKSKEKFKEHIGEILKEFDEDNGYYKKGNTNELALLANKRHDAKMKSRTNTFFENRNLSKLANKNRVQGK
jgi:hypothetical protein